MSTTRRICLLATVTVTLLLLCPPNCPAPLIWTKGEGWRYERSGTVTGKTPKEQLEIARTWQLKRNYGEAISAYQRLIKRWPTANAVQDARMGLAACLSGAGYHYKAYKEYQTLIEKNPNSDYFDQALQQQFEIGNLFLGGERVKIMGIKLFPGLDKAVEIFEQVVKNGPYSKVGPPAQYNLGLAYEKQKEYLSAVHAYEKLIERYPQAPLAESAQFAIGVAYRQEALRAEYDQDMANKSVAAFLDYLVRYPKGDRANLASLWSGRMKLEQADGLYRIGEFYEHQKQPKAALIYYNAVIEQSPHTDVASAAQKRIARLTLPPMPPPVLPAPAAVITQ